MSIPKTRICQGYSNMLTPLLAPVIIDWPKRQNSEEAGLWRSTDQNAPVSIFDQKRQLTLKVKKESSQHFKTFSWL
jgi:hypothetical protein